MWPIAVVHCMSPFFGCFFLFLCLCVCVKVIILKTKKAEMEQVEIQNAIDDERMGHKIGGGESKTNKEKIK